MNSRGTTRPVTAAGLALGIGLGGFLDGIVLHQIFQIHNMVSARVPTDTLVGAKVNMVWDGAFHLFVWAATVAGVALLWRAARRAARSEGVRLSTRALVGGMLAGWGLFNLVEGVVDHHLLGLHHVVERLGPSIWDWVFLASGAALVATGVLVVRGDSEQA